jgi:hypothetical protein
MTNFERPPLIKLGARCRFSRHLQHNYKPPLNSLQQVPTAKPSYRVPSGTFLFLAVGFEPTAANVRAALGLAFDQALRCGAALFAIFYNLSEQFTSIL